MWSNLFSSVTNYFYKPESNEQQESHQNNDLYEVEAYSDRTWRYFIEMIIETNSSILHQFIYTYFMTIKSNIYEILKTLQRDISKKLNESKLELFTEHVQLLQVQLHHLRVIEIFRKFENNLIDIISNNNDYAEVNEHVINSMMDIVEPMLLNVVDIEIEDDNHVIHKCRIDVELTRDKELTKEEIGVESTNYTLQLQQENDQLKHQNELLTEENKTLTKHLIIINKECLSHEKTILSQKQQIDNLHQQYLQIQQNDAKEHDKIDRELSKIKMENLYYKNRYPYLLKHIRLKMIEEHLEHGITYHSTTSDGKPIDVFTVNPNVITTSTISIPFILFKESICSFDLTMRTVSMAKLLTERSLYLKDSVWFFESNKFDLKITLPTDDRETDILSVDIELKDSLFGCQKSIELQNHSVITIQIPQSVEDGEIVFYDNIGYIKFNYIEDEWYYRSDYDLYYTFPIDDSLIGQQYIIPYFNTDTKWSIELNYGQFVVDNYGFVNHLNNTCGKFIINVVPK